MPILDVSPSTGDNAAGQQEAGGAAAAGDGASSQHRGVYDVAENVQSWDDKIRELRAEAQRIRDDRRKVMRTLKCSQAKAKRLREKARTLSESDMLQILKMKRPLPASNSAASTDTTPAASSSGGAGVASSSSSSSSLGQAAPASITTRFDEWLAALRAHAVFYLSCQDT